MRRLFLVLWGIIASLCFAEAQNNQYNYDTYVVGVKTEFKSTTECHNLLFSKKPELKELVYNCDDSVVKLEDFETKYFEKKAPKSIKLTYSIKFDEFYKKDGSRVREICGIDTIDVSNPHTIITKVERHHCSLNKWETAIVSFDITIDSPIKIYHKSGKGTDYVDVDESASVINLDKCYEDERTKYILKFKSSDDAQWKEVKSYDLKLKSGCFVQVSYSNLYGTDINNDEYQKNLGRRIEFMVEKTMIDGSIQASNIISAIYTKQTPQFKIKDYKLTSCKTGSYIDVVLINEDEKVFLDETAYWKVNNVKCNFKKIGSTYRLDISNIQETIKSIKLTNERISNENDNETVVSIDNSRTLMLSSPIDWSKKTNPTPSFKQSHPVTYKIGDTNYDIIPSQDPIASLELSENQSINNFKWPLSFKLSNNDTVKSFSCLPISYYNLEPDEKRKVYDSFKKEIDTEILNKVPQYTALYKLMYNEYLIKTLGVEKLEGYSANSDADEKISIPSPYDRILLLGAGTSLNTFKGILFANGFPNINDKEVIYIGDCNDNYNRFYNTLSNLAESTNSSWVGNGQVHTNEYNYSLYANDTLTAYIYKTDKKTQTSSFVYSINIYKGYKSIVAYSNGTVIAVDNKNHSFIETWFGQHASLDKKNRIYFKYKYSDIILNETAEQIAYVNSNGNISQVKINRTNLSLEEIGYETVPFSKISKLLNYEINESSAYIYYEDEEGITYKQKLFNNGNVVFNVNEVNIKYFDIRWKEYLIKKYGLKISVDEPNKQYEYCAYDADGCPSQPFNVKVTMPDAPSLEMVENMGQKPTSSNASDGVAYIKVAKTTDTNSKIKLVSGNTYKQGDIIELKNISDGHILYYQYETKNVSSDYPYSYTINFNSNTTTTDNKGNSTPKITNISAKNADKPGGVGSITATISNVKTGYNIYLSDVNNNKVECTPNKSDETYTFNNLSVGDYRINVNTGNETITHDSFVSIGQPSINTIIYSEIDQTGNWTITTLSKDKDLTLNNNTSFGDKLDFDTEYTISYHKTLLVESITNHEVSYSSTLKKSATCSNEIPEYEIKFSKPVYVNGDSETKATYIFRPTKKDEILFAEYLDSHEYTKYNSTITVISKHRFEVKINDISIPEKISATIFSSNLACYGQKQPIIEGLDITGGSGSYKYTVFRDENEVETKTIDGNEFSYEDNKAGQYKIVISNQSGICSEDSKSQTFTITQPSQITFSTMADSQICAGEENATIYVKDITGGTGVYSYYVDNEMFDAENECNNCEENLADIIAAHQSTTFSQLGAGTHVVTVMDSNYCFQQKEVEITPYQNPNVSFATSNPVSCNGLSDGVINIENYNWQTDITRDLCTELNCIKTIEYKGVSSAIVDFSQTIDNLVAGTYELYLVDNNNCRSDSVYNITIQQPEPIKLQAIQTSSKIAEYGTSGGGANFRVSGGNQGNSLLMCSDTVFDILTRDNNKIIEAFAAGDYSLYAIDSKGCHSDTVLLQFVQPQLPLSLTTTVKDALCKSSTGSILLDAQGGWGKYKFSIDNQTMLKSISDSFEFDGLYSGLHTVSVIDSMGAIRSAQVYVNQPDSLVVIPSVIPADDNNSYGKAILNISGGVSPYRSFGSFTSDTVKQSTAEFVLQPRAQFYSIETRDSNNCKVVTKVNVNKRNIDVELVSVYDRNDILSVPTLVAKVTGATSSCTYAWEKWNQDILSFENIPNAVSDTYYGQPKETYRVTVSDGLSSNSATASVEAAGVMSFDTIVVWYNSGGGNLSASAPCNVFASALIGNNNNHVDLTGCIQGNKVEASNLLSDNYLLVAYAIDTIKPLGLSLGDILNDSIKLDTILITSNVKILNPEPIEIWTEVTPVSEAMAYDGYVSVSIYGGMPQFEYTLCHNADPDDTLVGTVDNNGSFVIDNLPSGDYTITVKGQRNQDVASSSFVIEAPLQNLSLSAEVTDALCYGDSSGMVRLTALGGWGDYQFAYNDNQVSDKSDYGFGLRSSYYGLPYGTHTFYVIDGIGTIYRIDSLVNQPDSLRIVSAKVDSVSCYSYNDGVVKLTIDGGFGQYHSFWHTATQATIFDMNITTDSLFYADNYLFFVKDDNNCRSVDYEVVVPQPDSLQLQIIDTTHTTCELNNGRISVKYVGGSLPYHYNWICNGDSMNENKSTIENLVGRNEYQIKVMDAHGCQSATTVQRINTSKNPKINCIIVDSVSCYGYNDGVMHVNYKGVSPAYPYAPWLVQWPNGTQSGWLSSNLDSTWSGGYYTGSYNVIFATQITALIQ